jgi:hypothetical protein
VIRSWLILSRSGWFCLTPSFGVTPGRTVLIDLLVVVNDNTPAEKVTIKSRH